MKALYGGDFPPYNFGVHMNLDIEMLYETYGPMVLRRCRSLLKNEDKAQDAMQEVFLKLVEKSRHLKAEYPSSLLYTMATNICLNKIRDEGRKNEVGGDDLLHVIASYDKTENRLMASETLDIIFGKMQPSTRDIAVLYFIDEMTLQEVSDTVGLSLSGIRKRLKKLKEHVHQLREAGHEIL